MSSGETFSSSLGLGGLNSPHAHPGCEIEFTNLVQSFNGKIFCYSCISCINWRRNKVWNQTAQLISLCERTTLSLEQPWNTGTSRRTWSRLTSQRPRSSTPQITVTVGNSSRQSASRRLPFICMSQLGYKKEQREPGSNQPWPSWINYSLPFSITIHYQ